MVLDFLAKIGLDFWEPNLTGSYDSVLSVVRPAEAFFNHLHTLNLGVEAGKPEKGDTE
jgi:hypothetical protein